MRPSSMRKSQSAHSEQEKNEGLQVYQSIKREEYIYPDEIKSVKYPEHPFDDSSTMFDHMFALSATTLLRNIDDFPFFGRLSQSFTPFEIFNPQNSIITFYAGPRYHQDIKTYHLFLCPSRTKKNYVFQLQLIAPRVLELSCFAAIFPSPGYSSHLNILARKNIKKEEEQDVAFHLEFDVETSKNKQFDFDILLFDLWQQDLVLLQVNIKSGEILKRQITPPSLSGIIVMSTSLVTYTDQNYESFLYDIHTAESSKIFESLQWAIQSTEFVTILGNEQDKMIVFNKKTRKFIDIGIKISSLDRVFEFNSLFIHFGYKMCNIFKIRENQSEIMYKTEYVLESYNFFFTSYYILEYINEALGKCLTFAKFLQKEKATKKKIEASKKQLQGYIVVGHLNERDLVLTQNNQFLLVSAEEPPTLCVCFQNEDILGITPPLLLEIPDQTTQSEYLIWNGSELQQIKTPQRDCRKLIYICDSEPDSATVIPEIEVEHLGAIHWGIFISDTAYMRDQFHQKTWELLGYYFTHNTLSNYFNTLDGFYQRGKISIEGQEYCFQLQEEQEMVTFYKNKIYDNDSIDIMFTGGKLKFVNHCRNRIIAKIKWDQKPTEYYTLELLKFRKPVSIHVNLELRDFKINLRKGQKEVILLVPIETEHSPNWDVESIVDLVNHYQHFKFNGLDFRFLKYLQVPFSVIDEIRREDGYIELSDNAPEQLTHPLSAKFQEQLAQLYVKLDKCSTHSLLLFYFGQFGSLQEMDAVIAPGRFITALSYKLKGFPDQFVNSIFENCLVFLHFQAQGLSTSLKGFYDGALKQIGQYHIKAPPSQVSFESEEEKEDDFKAFLQSKSPNQKHVITIFRSGLKFPPSSHKTTLGLAEQLCTTKDLPVFQSKLIQIYIQQRWKDSVWFFCLQSVLILTGIFILFLHGAFFRTPYIIVPLLVLQVFNFLIEVIQVKRKKCRYFHDFWNLFDVLRIVFAFVYFGVAITQSTSQDTRLIFLMLLILCQCVKAFSIFSLFKSTRVLLRTVIEIVQDMVPFFIFVFATTLAFSLLFASAIPEDSLKYQTYPSLMMRVFRLDFGDFSPNKYTPLEQSIFIMAVISVPLVLLNMLIAIMGDTFDRVKQEQSRRDFQEMAGLVYRYEIIAEWMCDSRRRRQKVWKYIFYSEEAKSKGEEVIDPWQGRIKGIKLLIERMQIENQQWQRESSERQMKSEERQKKTEEWQRKVEEKWLKKNEQTQQQLLKRSENQEKQINAIKEILKQAFEKEKENN